MQTNAPKINFIKLLLTEWQFNSAVTSSLLKRILLLALAILILGMTSEIAMLSYLFMDEGISYRWLVFALILTCQAGASFLFFHILGIPGIIMSVKQRLEVNALETPIKAELFKITLCIIVIMLVINPCLTFLTLPDNLTALIARYAIYALLLPLLWLPLHFFAIPLIIIEKLSWTAALKSAFLSFFQHWRSILIGYSIVMMVSILFLAVLFLLSELINYAGIPTRIWFIGAASVFPYFALVAPLNPMWYTLGGKLYRDSYSLNSLTQV